MKDPKNALPEYDDADNEDAEEPDTDISEGEEEQHEPIWVKPLDKERRSLLLSRGLPGADFIPSGTKFDLVDFLISMEPELPGVKNRPVSTKRQASNLRTILRDPLKHPYSIGLSSYPSDARAKYVAQMIMSAAVDSYNRNRKKHGTRSLPHWHRVYGGYKDALRDRQTPLDPCMLIISNIHDESSSMKIEKVRDLLEMYSHIPRIVITGGRPVIDLFAYRLSYPMQAGIYIGPQNLIKGAV